VLIVGGTAVRALLRSGEHRMWNLLIIEDATNGMFFFYMPSMKITSSKRKPASQGLLARRTLDCPLATLLTGTNPVDFR
jgi:hypothetical protein